MRQRIDELEKINKRQSKFIDSVQSMRRAVEKTNEQCSLKQLWRWLKMLPTNK